MDDRSAPNDRGVLDSQPLQMGDRVQYVSGREHPDLINQKGVVIRTQGQDAVVQLDAGHRVFVDMQGLHKVAMQGDHVEIEQIAEEVFGQETSEVEPDVTSEEPVQNEQAVYYGEDRDVAAPAGQSPHTTSGIEQDMANPNHPTNQWIDQQHQEMAQAPVCTECNGERMLNGQPCPMCHATGKKIGTDMSVESKWDVLSLGQDGGNHPGGDNTADAGRHGEPPHELISQHFPNYQPDPAWNDHRHEAKMKFSLGEQQQPGGVGAVMDDHNPAIDGPNPDGPNFSDNAGNSHEQEIALKRWVDVAVDMMNRGDDPELILAKLAHDGCPEPEAVLQRAQQQPPHSQDEAPVTDEALSAPLPAPANPESETAMANMPSGVQARVKVGHVEGTLQGYFTSQWDEPMARVALDNGQVRELPASEVQEIATAVDEPVEQVQTFIDSFPAVDEQRKSSVESRVNHLNTARNRISRLMNSSIEPRQRLALDAMDVQLHRELAERKDQARNFVNDADLEYVKEQPKYDIQVVEQESMGHGHNDGYFMNDQVIDQNEEVENTDFDKVVSEDSAIMVNELPSASLNDLGQVHQLAASYIDRRTAGLTEGQRAELRGRFVSAVMDERDVRLAELNSEPDDEPEAEEETHIDEDSATALFL